MTTTFRSISTLLIILLSSTLLLTACPGGGTTVRPYDPGYSNSNDGTSRDREAEDLASAGEYGSAARRYAQLANNSYNNTRNGLLLRAAELWLLAEKPAQARMSLRNINASTLTQNEQYLNTLLDAATTLAEDRYDDAYSQLNIPLNDWPNEQRVRALLFRGQAALRAGKLAKGISDFNARGELLIGTSADENQDLLWNELASAPLINHQLSNDDTVIQGWIELAKIGQSQWLAPRAIQERIETWKLEYPTHPANQRIVSRINAPIGNQNLGDGSFPTQVALLVPISGRYKGVGEAIRNGFMNAWFDDSGSPTRPEVRVYDTKGSPDGAIEAYKTAVREGNMMVVGPVLRNSVDGIVNVSSTMQTVPMLSLNRASNPSLYQGANLLQFSLDPSDESRDAAERLAKLGYSRGLAFVPDTDYGRQQFEIFARRFQQLNGQIVNTHFYDPEETDFRKPLREMAAFNPSKSRRRELNATIGVRVAYEPRRAGDVEFMFMIANPIHGRLLKPQLKYISAGDIPIYATSSVYTGKHEQIADRDMNGVQFNATPWTLEARPDLADLRDTFKQKWPEQFFRNHKIYPLGLDAYQLIQMTWDSSDIDWRVDGASGRLTAGPRNIVNRSLAWAEFDNGLPRIVEALDDGMELDLFGLATPENY